MKKNLIGLDRDQLAQELTALDEKPFRTKQLWNWIYHRGVRDFSVMTNLGKGLREKLAASYVIERPEIVVEQNSTDHTRKWLLRCDDGAEIETVHIPEEDRGAVCISSQVGCTLTCSFCRTGTQRLVRNLDAGEIVGQFMVARDSYGEWPTPRDDVRDVLVPINRKYPIRELIAAGQRYPGANNARRITFEYVLLKGVNDSMADVRELVRLINGLPAKFNLIPFNPWPGAPYESSSPGRAKAFSQALNDAGYSAPIRVPRGRDILAVCGQLKSASERVCRDQQGTRISDMSATPGPDDRLVI